MAVLVGHAKLISVEIDTSDLISARAKLMLLPKAVDAVAYVATQEATDYLKEVVKELTPVGEGEGRGGVRSHAGQTHLRTAWAMRVRGAGPEYVGTVFNPKPYARAVEEGRPPTTIRVRRKKFLWWPSIINARMTSVPWPGFAGRRMAGIGLNSARAGIFRIYTRNIDAVIKRVFG